MKSRLALIAAALIAAGTAAATAASPPITGAVLGSAEAIIQPDTIQLSATNGVLMETATAAPGASFGWHYHRTALSVVITKGTLTLYDSKDPSCTPHRYSAGEGFIEPANRIHLARNEGTEPVVLYATYLGVARGTDPGSLDVNVTRPGNCPF